MISPAVSGPPRRQANELSQLAIGLALSLAVPGLGCAKDDPARTDDVQPAASASSGGPYCGVYSLYAALRSQRIDVQFEALLQNKYVGSAIGSNLAELQSAATDFGAYGLPLQGLTATALRASSYPIVLHVRRPGKDTQFLHWVLYLGTEGENARILDPPDEVMLLPFAQLMSLWDGLGLVVSKEPVATASLLWPSWIEHAVLLLVAGLLVRGVFMLFHWGPKNRTAGSVTTTCPSGGAIRRTLGLVVALMLLTCIYHLLIPEGFFLNRVALAEVAARHFEPRFPEVSVSEVAEMLGRSNVTLVDARMPRDYRSGHLPNAVNISITAGMHEKEQKYANIDSESFIIVYCQSKGCQWSHAVGSDLVFRGFDHVAIFRGGWVEWEEHERSKLRR